MSDETAKLTFKGQEFEFPVREGTIGPSVVDIGALYKNTGAFTYDPGFTSTASCDSEITFIDGDEGMLLHRGYPIEQLAEHGDFLEVCYLLLYGELPTKAQNEDFHFRVTHHTMVHEADEPVLHRLPARCASDGGHVWCCWRDVGLLSRLY